MITFMKNRTRVVFLSAVIWSVFVLTTPGQSSQYKRNFPSSRVSCDPAKPVENTIFGSYGAAYLADGLVFPSKCLLTGAEIDRFQAKLVSDGNVKPITGLIGYQLQNAAADSLNKVISELRLFVNNPANRNSPKAKAILRFLNRQRLESNEVQFVIPRECNRNKVKNPFGCDVQTLFNRDFARRDFSMMVGNWNGRIITRPKLKGHSELILGSNEDSNSLHVKIKLALDLDSDVHLSAAIPGASQHILMSAIDVNTEICSPGSKCEELLMRNGWFRTVCRDNDHFTYLGLNEGDLQSLGLLQSGVTRKFYTPRICS